MGQGANFSAEARRAKAEAPSPPELKFGGLRFAQPTLRGELFIARHDLNAKQEVLVLLRRNATATADFLEKNVGDSNKSRVRRILREMVTDKLIGQAANGDFFIMPRGQALVIDKSLLHYRP